MAALNATYTKHITADLITAIANLHGKPFPLVSNLRSTDDFSNAVAEVDNLRTLKVAG